MKPNDLQLGNETIGQILGEILFELSPALPLEFGPATIPGPRALTRALARALSMTKPPAESKTEIEVSTQLLPPPPAPKVETPSLPPPRPITSKRPVLERRGL